MREQKDRYEIFLKVCETGSFSKAAEALNYTQSGISQMMAGLEEELGVKLFARINRGVTLTDNGTRLLPYVRELANQKNRLRQAAFNINHKVEGKLRVGSFSKAAEALNYTQSGISQMMAGLEEELGVKLFARINRGVTLTDNGTRLLPYVRELANQKNRLRQAAFNINHKVEGKLRVGSFSSITTLWMPEVVHYFKENYPKVSIEILDGNYDEIREWIIHGQVDCGFLSSIVADDLKFYPLWDDPLCAVFPEGHPLAARPSVTLSQLFQYPLIIETPGCDNDIQHLMLKCPVKPNISYSFRDDTLIMAFVRSGLGVTISQELVMQAFGCPGVVSRPLEPACCRTLGLAFSKTASSVVSKTLLEYLRSTRQRKDTPQIK